MRRKIIKFILLIFSLITLLPNTSVASEQKIKVVASIAPLADFVRQVGRDKVDVILLLPPGASPHTYELTPKKVSGISKAAIFVKIGAGLEFWTDKLIKAANSGITVVDCSKGIELMRYDNHNLTNNKNHNFDPHIWLDPVISIKIIEKIENALSKADPDNSSVYKKNASLYTEQLSELDRTIRETVNSFRTKEYVTFHPAWNYFSRRYGLKVAGVIEEGAGKEPTPKHLTMLLGELKRMRTKIVFAESQFSPKIAEAIAKEAGAQLLFLDPIGGQKDRETYIDLMKFNLNVMEKAMK